LLLVGPYNRGFFSPFSSAYSVGFISNQISNTTNTAIIEPPEQLIVAVRFISLSLSPPSTAANQAGHRPHPLLLVSSSAVFVFMVQFRHTASPSSAMRAGQARQAPSHFSFLRQRKCRGALNCISSRSSYPTTLHRYHNRLAQRKAKD
jgi:hypothetical protein